MKDFSLENRAYWTKRAPGYSSVNQEELGSSQRVVWRSLLDNRIRAHFPGHDRTELRVLDIGTGPGFFSIILAELGYAVAAVDYTEAMLEQARRNAGALAGKIDFRTLDAEALSFPDESFDILVSRNLTWNLHRPEQAYFHWARVLKKGGLLLNFDANWYRYLFDPAAREGRITDRANVAQSGVPDDTAGTDVAAMEAIARRTPLSTQIRPGWDLAVLRGLGLEAKADEAIWRRVWTEAERVNNASTPLFLIQGIKPLSRNEAKAVI